MAIQSNNNNLNYLINPTFTKVKRFFFFFFHSQEMLDEIIFSFSHLYVQNVEIKDFNVLIDGKIFFDLLVKMKKDLTIK